ncbi:MAG: OmpA/MotB domain protein [Frankiales bacterium]|nr:OmpA/MotB domain protein [Frankiales bacterium]
MSRRRHAVHEEGHENQDRWLLTYADLITLLLALFMMLYAMSVLDLKKYEAFQEAFTQGMGKHVHSMPGVGDPPNGQKLQTKPGALVGKPDPSPSPVSDQLKPALDQAALRDLKKKLDHELALTGLQNEVQVDLDPRGLVVNVVSGVLFDSAQATVTYRGQRLLTSLGVVFSSMRNPLVVEGHTDPRPISSASFPSNWELSTARATAVLRFLLNNDHLQATRLSAAGYADTRPRATNSTEAGMAANRRVDIVVIAAPKAAPKTAATPTTATKASATPSPGPHH